MSARTERLEMVPLAVSHAAPMLAPLADPRLYTYIPDEPPATLDALEATYRRLCSGGHPERGEHWLNWLMRARAGGGVIGTLQATIYADRRAVIGYMVLAEHWRRGYGREGVGWLAAYLSVQPDVEVIAAHVDTRNAGSIGVLERAGFTRRALLPAADFFKGSPSDEYVYERRAIVAA